MNFGGRLGAMTCMDRPRWRAQMALELVMSARRLAIAGGPRTGKTTLAGRLIGRSQVHTDDFMALPWAEVPEATIAACSSHQCFVVEGVQVARALRKGLEVDAVIWMGRPMVTLSDGQASMAKGVYTVFQEWVTTNAGRIPILTHG